MAQQIDTGKFDRTAWVLIACGGIAFIDTFLPWASVSAFGASISGNAWNVGFWAWFPMLLLLALGVAAFLPGIGVSSIPHLHLIALGVSALALLIVLIRWATYPAFVGAGAGLIIGLLLALAVGAAAFMTETGRATLAKLRTSASQSAPPPANGSSHQPPGQQYQPPDQQYPPPGQPRQ